MVIVQFIFPSSTFKKFKYQLILDTTRITPNVFPNLLWNTTYIVQGLTMSPCDLLALVDALFSTVVPGNMCTSAHHPRRLDFESCSMCHFKKNIPKKRWLIKKKNSVFKTYVTYIYLNSLYSPVTFRYFGPMRFGDSFSCIWGAVRTTFSPRKFRISTVWQPGIKLEMKNSEKKIKGQLGVPLTVYPMVFIVFSRDFP